MKTIKKTVEVIEKFELQATAVGWETSFSLREPAQYTANFSVPCWNGDFSLPVSKEFQEELVKRKVAKIKMEITFID